MDEIEKKWRKRVAGTFFLEKEEEEAHFERLKAEAREFEEELNEYKALPWPKNLIGTWLKTENIEIRPEVDGMTFDEALNNILETLTELNAKLLTLFFEERKSFEEIGAGFSIYFVDAADYVKKAYDQFLHHRADHLRPFIVGHEQAPQKRRTLDDFLNDSDDDSDDGKEDNT